jgi:hypothetical protein
MGFNWVLAMALIVVWIRFQFAWGNKYFATIVIFFALSVLLVRWNQLQLIEAIVLTIILLWTSSFNTMLDIKQATLGAIQDPRPGLTAALTPNSGREVLPEVVQQMLSLLESHQITKFQVSKAIAQDVLVSQRLTESAWPRIWMESQYLLCGVSEVKQNPTWVIVDTRKDVALVYYR